MKHQSDTSEFRLSWPLQTFKHRPLPKHHSSATVKKLTRAFLAGNFDKDDLEITRAEGSFLYDEHGRKYFDFNMGWCVGNLGWGNRHIQSRIRHSQFPGYVAPHYRYRGCAELAEILAKITPGNLKKCFRATGGSEAVDIALQVAIAATKRRKFLSLEGSYHGNTLAGLSVGGPSGESAGHFLPGCEKIAPPLDEKALARIDLLLRKRDVAAFIMEPVVLNLNVLVPERAFMKELGALCRRYGTLLIMDEVATGFGRTGRMFASEDYDIEPDVLCLAKGITGGYAPLGAAVVTEKVEKSAHGKVKAYSTYGWHPLAVEAALANLHWIIEHKSRLLDNVNKMSDYFLDRIASMPFREVVILNAKGLAIGVEVGDRKYAETIRNRCRKNGLLIGAGGESLLFYPALNITREVAKEGLDILESCV